MIRKKELPDFVYRRRSREQIAAIARAEAQLRESRAAVLLAEESARRVAGIYRALFGVA